jgi:small subunit ribosomal protein S17
MKILQGTVVSLKTAQTAKVSVSRLWQHPVYKKSVKRTKNYACHVEGIELQVGDEVLIQETTPISKTKRFKVIAKVEETN